MEEKEQSSTQETIDQTVLNNTETIEGWVSPDVAAAQAGERVEMGKNLDEDLPE